MGQSRKIFGAGWQTVAMAQIAREPAFDFRFGFTLKIMSGMEDFDWVPPSLLSQ
jgi:hypothetical protein